jgi:hypothetical protein
MLEDVSGENHVESAIAQLIERSRIGDIQDKDSFRKFLCVPNGICVAVNGNDAAALSR